MEENQPDHDSTLSSYPTIVLNEPGRTALHLTIVEPLVIGRECDGILLFDERVSRRHLRLVPEGSTLWLEDLDSTNGTYVDGNRVHGRVRLDPGQNVAFGKVALSITGSITPGTVDARVALPVSRDGGGTVVATVD